MDPEARTIGRGVKRRSRCSIRGQQDRGDKVRLQTHSQLL